MPAFAPHVDWIGTQHELMCRRVITWSDVNSGTANLQGLAMAALLRKEFGALKGSFQEIPLQPAGWIDTRGQPVRTQLGSVLRFTKRRDDPAARRVLLNIHMDTVYPADHPFQTVSQLDHNTLRGPGVADAKGGLAVMLTALQALERSPWANSVAWEVLINSDEEIGSPGSAALLARSARDNQVGLLFEPAMPDGSMVARRRGTGNYTIVVHGRPAHAGRDFARGRSAVVTLAEIVLQLHAMNDNMPGVIVNVGRVEGGGPLNVVPDLASIRANIRIAAPEDEAKVTAELRRLVGLANSRDGLRAELFGSITSPPKLPDERTRRLMDAVEECGRELTLPISWRDSGGASDGNKLAAAGLPNVDTFGPRGGDIHSPNEYLLMDSLVERARLTALMLMKIAAGQVELGGGGAARE